MVIVCDCLQRCLPVQNGLVWPSCCDMWILTSLDAECHHWLGTDRPSRRSRTFGAAWARSNHLVGGAQHLPGPWGLLGQKCSRMSRDVKSKAGFSGCYHRSNSVPGSALLAVEGCFSMVLQVSFSDFSRGYRHGLWSHLSLSLRHHPQHYHERFCLWFLTSSFLGLGLLAPTLSVITTRNKTHTYNIPG